MAVPDIQVGPVAPGSAFQGQLWWDTNNSRLNVFNGQTWNVTALVTRPLGPSLFAIGDSITTNGSSSQGVMTGNLKSATSYLAWAVLLSNGKFSYKGQSGTSGFTAAQILASHLPVALQAKPNICVVLAGTNDAQAGGFSLPATQVSLISIYRQLVNADIIPVICTIPPQNAASTTINTNIARLNHWLFRYASQQGFPFVDIHSAVTDSTTNGQYTAGLNSDNFHPNAAGAKVIGQSIATALGNAFPTAKIPLCDWNGDPGYNAAWNNGLQLIDTNADGLPDGWTAAGSPTYTNPAIGNGRLGKYMKVVRVAADSFNNMSVNTHLSMSPGDTIYWAFAVGITAQASVTTPSVTLFNADSTQKLSALFAWTTDIPDGSVWAEEITVPAGLSNYNAFIQVAVVTNAGSEARIGQISCMNLSSIGAV